MNTGSLEFDVTKYWKFRKKTSTNLSLLYCCTNLNDPDILVHYNIMHVCILIYRINSSVSLRKSTHYNVPLTIIKIHRDYINNMYSTSWNKCKSGVLERLGNLKKRIYSLKILKGQTSIVYCNYKFLLFEWEE